MSRRRPGCLRREPGLALKRRLAKRDGGARCFYCRTAFADLAAATFDHYVPYRLWRRNLPRNLVLACGPCNHAKADALPWPLVWLLLASVRPPVELVAVERPGVLLAA